jgi:xanthine dehydrogenase molybdopterin-binding subunit B
VKVVNQPLRKKDAMQLVTGQPVYVDDVTPRDCLCVKLLRSPHANAIVKSINKTAAMKVPGMEAIFTWEDVDQDGRRYTQAGQTYPEASPYDRLVIDRHVRFVGDVVAILAGADEKCVDKAMKLVKVEYEVLEPISTLQRTIRCSCIRRTTGRALRRSARTTGATCARTTSAATAISMRSSRTAMSLSTACTTRRHASRR